MIEGIFPNRAEAGRRLAQSLSAYRGRADTIVLGLPRGGVPVAYEVARQLGLPLDVFVVRKLGVPGYEELAMGAIASGGVPFGVSISGVTLSSLMKKKSQMPFSFFWSVRKLWPKARGPRRLPLSLIARLH